MKGTGTLTDPYIITTVQELYSMDETGSPETCFALGSDIDLNGTPAARDFTPIPLNCRRLDGRGHSIRNILRSSVSDHLYIFCIGDDCTDIELTGLTVDNVRFRGAAVTVFGGRGCNVTMKGCNMAVKAVFGTTPSADLTFFGGGVTVYADLCSFVFCIDWRQQGMIMLGGRLTRCQLRLDLTAAALYYGTGSAVPVIGGAEISDTGFMGGLACSDYYNRNAIIFYGGSLANSYMAFRAGGNTQIWLSNTVSVLSTCFYNSELKDEGAAFYLGGFSALTGEQCRNVEYLRSIGFECGEGA